MALRLISALSEQREEFHHVARVLHESVGQMLTVVGLQLDLLRDDFATGGEGLPERVAAIQQLLEQALEDVRVLSYRMNPEVVPRSGLRHALNLLAGRYREKWAGTIRLLVDSRVQVGLPSALALYEIAKEALDNVVRHSEATLAEVVLQPHPNGVRLEISDNGKGFDVPAVLNKSYGFGLLWMHHRAGRSRIELTIQSSPEKGTRILASCPLLPDRTPDSEVATDAALRAKE